MCAHTNADAHLTAAVISLLIMCYCAVEPPSTGNAAPVIDLAPSSTSVSAIPKSRPSVASDGSIACIVNVHSEKKRDPAGTGECCRVPLQTAGDVWPSANFGLGSNAVVGGFVTVQVIGAGAGIEISFKLSFDTF